MNFGQQLIGFQQQFIQFQQQSIQFQQRVDRRFALIDATIKYTDGDGHDLALAICGHAALPAAAQMYQPNAAVGDLVIFYNDDLKIDAGDILEIRKHKVRTWMTHEQE
ncbi:hypothetical protein F5888DRAFT_1804981 [Russula emetica]|nr:hypothetical protein F5888DRAFT_1804981 [Russula emetica]